jgi:hypothetical protein
MTSSFESLLYCFIFDVPSMGRSSRPKINSTREPTPTPATHTTRNTQEQNKINIALCKRTRSPAGHVIEDRKHQTRPKIDAGNAFLLMGE